MIINPQRNLRPCVAEDLRGWKFRRQIRVDTASPERQDEHRQQFEDAESPECVDESNHDGLYTKPTRGRSTVDHAPPGGSTVRGESIRRRSAVDDDSGVGESSERAPRCERWVECLVRYHVRDRSLHHTRLSPTRDVPGIDSLRPSVHVGFLPRPENCLVAIERRACIRLDSGRSSGAFPSRRHMRYCSHTDICRARNAQCKRPAIVDVLHIHPLCPYATHNHPVLVAREPNGHRTWLTLLERPIPAIERVASSSSG